jgi:hypothetical protein
MARRRARQAIALVRKPGSVSGCEMHPGSYGRTVAYITAANKRS